MVDEAKWKTYERVRAEVESTYGDCEVTYDHKVRGVRSKVDRQVDIWLATSIGDGHELTVAIECKCYETTPVGIKDVDALYGFLDDVGASKAVLFSNSGFTSGAYGRADDKRVALREFSLDEDAGAFNWGNFLELDPCEIQGCWGMIDWNSGLMEDAPEDGPPPYRAGFCERCRTLHIDCPNCGAFEVSDERGDVACDGCGSIWELELDRKGAGVTSIKLVDQSQSDDG